MKVMQRDTWPEIMEGAERSVLILAPWIDDNLVKELFGFLPPIDVQVVFPQSTLDAKGHKEFRYTLRGVLDTNFDAEIRVIGREIPACLVVDGEEFYYSATYADRLEDVVDDTTSGIAFARRTWNEAEPWE